MHRRIAQARVGTALAGGHQLEIAAGLLDRHHDAHLVAVGLDVLLEGLVELHLAGGQHRGAEAGARRGELELLPIKVVAGRDLEADLDALRVQRPRRELKCLLRLEEVVGGARLLDGGAEQDRQSEKHETGGSIGDESPCGPGQREKGCLNLHGSAPRRETDAWALT